ncbi:MAG: hypothetical protein RI945_363, partial [Candidatus Parcubacteria bacterium]
AYRNGDNTAFNAGRLTLNPLSHIDFIGSIIVPIFSYYALGFPFGWAKPVPYVPDNIKHKRFAELEVASAGILTNFFLAFLSVLLFYLLRSFGIYSEAMKDILQLATSINLFLGFFNLLPFPPADGFSIFSELFSHGKSLFVAISNKFRRKKFYETTYLSSNSSFKDFSFKIKHLFSNPFLMIFIILIAVNVFSLLVPYIVSFINYLFSF